jgi:hypothetical protein
MTESPSDQEVGQIADELGVSPQAIRSRVSSQLDRGYRWTVKDALRYPLMARLVRHWSNLNCYRFCYR